MDLTVVELFAGVGGFRVGLNNVKDFNKDNGLAIEEGNWKFVWANQWEPSRKSQDAFQCYIQRFGDKKNHVNIDIGQIAKTSIPNHNLLVGGFPCQDYSVARTGAKGIQGQKGVLWWEIYEVLKAKNPPFVLLENVDRLLKSPSSQRGRDFGIMLGCLNQLNYSVEWRVINAAEYGFHQRRRRVFIFAFKNSTNYGKKVKDCTSQEWIHSKGFFQAQFPILDLGQENYKHGPSLLEFDDLVDISEKFSFKFENSGIMSEGKIYTEKTQPYYQGDYRTLGDVLEGDVDERFYLNGELDDWKKLKGSKKIERVSKTGHKYTFSEGAIAFPDPIDRPARTMLTSEATKNRSTHIIKDPETGRLRKLTPVETERLNCFPTNWTNTGMSERFRYFCMGNALVVGLIEKMGKELKRIFENEK